MIKRKRVGEGKGDERVKPSRISLTWQIEQSWLRTHPANPRYIWNRCHLQFRMSMNLILALCPSRASNSGNRAVGHNFRIEKLVSPDAFLREIESKCDC